MSVCDNCTELECAKYGCIYKPNGGRMIFELESTKSFFNEAEKNHYEKMGFVFERKENPHEEDECFYLLENPMISFHSIESLKEWVESLGIKEQLIINFEDKTIEIYNDYRE